MRFQMFSSAFLLLTLIFTNSNHLTFVSGQCLQAQKNFLLELRNNLTYNSSLSTKLVQWDESVDCCEWIGVKCDNKGRVLNLDLSNETISAGINDSSSSLFRLVFLESLNLAQNNLHIDFPSGFGNLKDLRYLNLSKSGFSGQIPSEFSNLTRLVVLDLSLSSSLLRLENPDLGRLIHNYTRLRELYLDDVNVSARGSVWCTAISSSLPELRVLSLNSANLTGPLCSSLVKLKSLSVIRLDFNNFSTPLPDFFADFPNLRVLTISWSNLLGVAPAKLFQIKSLETLDLSWNTDLEGSLPEFPANLAIKNMFLSNTKFSGNVPESIGRLKMLSTLHLNGCLFSGRIPSSIKNLTQLVYLRLYMNHFVGSVPSFAFLKNLEEIDLRGNGLTGQIHDSLWQGLENLYFLDLADNSLEGYIPPSVFHFPLLRFLYLSNNSFSGSIRDTSNGSYYPPLEELDLSNNNLTGPIPRFFFELQNLHMLGLSSNKFNGSLDLTNFRKLRTLYSLYLSDNNLSVRVKTSVSISSLFPRLKRLMLASCNLQKFPPLKNHSSLGMLDISNNNINGKIPSWIWEAGGGYIQLLNLSHNQFTRLQEPYDFPIIDYLDLHANTLGGQIPLPPPGAIYVDFSHNNFSSSLPNDIGNFLTNAIFFSVSNNSIMGTIPPSFCNSSVLEIVDMSNNFLHGRIPSCLLQHSKISVLDLRKNNLGGDIPDTFQLDCRLQTLDLSSNYLLGKVPKSLERCTNLGVLNLGDNKLNDVFPCRLKNLSKLRVLVLRFNKFHGNISCLGDSSWTNLQIINIASNNLNGVLPENLFQNLESMSVAGKGHLGVVSSEMSDIYYQDSVTVTLKGQVHELVKILKIFIAIDFSDNHFCGAIPQTLGELKSLYVLNFSRNALSGHIPSSIGNLKTLESLDLSSNNLSGKIPDELGSLTFLSFMNFSYNQLVGKIPRGAQIERLEENSFLGNPGLCGVPLNKSCNAVSSPALGVPEARSEEQDIVSDIGIYVSAVVGFFVGLAILFWPVIFSRRWRRCYNRNVNKFILFVLNPAWRRKDGG